LDAKADRKREAVVRGGFSGLESSAVAMDATYKLRLRMWDLEFSLIKKRYKE
jgi:hypothetical protein